MEAGIGRLDGRRQGQAGGREGWTGGSGRVGQVVGLCGDFSRTRQKTEHNRMTRVREESLGTRARMHDL